MWLLGFLRSTLPVGLIHLLLIVAVISLVMHFCESETRYISSI
jgi:hypothetical protein